MVEHLPKSWKRGFEAAAAASEYSNGAGTGERMGSALYSGSSQVSVGFNIYNKTHPASGVFGGFNLGIHAEHAALIKRRHYSNNNLIMYVYRQHIASDPNKHGKNGCSKPCANCMKLLAFAGVRWVRYINEFGKAEEMRIN